MLTNTRPLSSAFLFLVTVAFTADAKENTDWQVYLGGKERNLYSSLMQINRDNVVDLQVAWAHETGDKAEYQANNLIVDGLMSHQRPVARWWLLMPQPERYAGSGIRPRKVHAKGAPGSVAWFIGRMKMAVNADCLPAWPTCSSPWTLRAAR